MNEELYKRLAKIKMLADRGVGGEAENAREIFASLLAANGLSQGDFDAQGEKEISAEFEVNGKHPFWRLFIQIASSLELAIYHYTEEGIKKAMRGCSPDIRREVKKTFEAKLKLTELKGAASKIEDFRLQWEIYCEALKEEQEATYLAFIQANRIFPPKKDNSEPQERKPLTAIQKKALARAMEMEKVNIRKRLN